MAEKADAYLAHIEASGLERFFSSLHALSSPPVAAIWHDLGVRSGGVLPRKEPEIVIALPVTGGAYGKSLVLAAMETVASTSDNLEKMAMSGATERHLAVYVDRSATSVLMALRDLQPPSDVPDLPDEVTDVWLLAPGRHDQAPDTGWPVDVLLSRLPAVDGGEGIQCGSWRG